LPAHPSAHVNVPISSTGPGGVHVQAYAGLPLFTIAASSTGNVKGHRHEIADIKEFDVAAFFDDLARDLVAQDHAGGRCRAASHHVLIAAANVRGDDLENDSVLALAVA
jgi:hypothetical protein